MLRGLQALALVAAAVALCSCKKDEPAPVPVRTESGALKLGTPPKSPTPAKAAVTGRAKAQPNKDGTTRYDLAELTISLPTDWKALDFSREDIKNIMDQAARENPHMQQLLPMINQAASSGAIKLMAFDFKNATRGFTDNVNVLWTDTPPGATFEQVLAENERQAKEELKGMNVRRQATSIDGQPAGLITWHMPATANDNKVQLALRGYVAVREGKLCIVTFTALAEHERQVARVADKAVASIDLK